MTKRMVSVGGGVEEKFVMVKFLHYPIQIAPNEVAGLYFPIVPTTIGSIDVKLEAMTALMSDGIVKKLLVEVCCILEMYLAYDFRPFLKTNLYCTCIHHSDFHVY